MYYVYIFNVYIMYLYKYCHSRYGIITQTSWKAIAIIYLFIVILNRRNQLNLHANQKKAPKTE